MEKIQIEQSVKEYLVNETKLYQDWYKALNQIEEDSDTIPYGFSIPSLEELKEGFKKWFNEQEDFLREIICEKWDYPTKRAQFQTKQLLIVGLAADGLATVFLIPTQTLTTATILVIDGYLERLCSKLKIPPSNA